MKIGIAFKGGGLRGVISLRIAERLERAAGAPLVNFVDAMAGTSTGACIATLLACPKGYSAAEVRMLYRKLGKEVFPWQLLGTPRHIATVKHKIEVLVSNMEQLTDYATMRQSQVPLVIPTADANTNQPVHIKSFDPFWLSFPMGRAAAASSAAQTYFKALQSGYTNPASRYIDGGNMSGNPADDLYYDMQHLYPGEDIAIIAIGTGRPSKKLSEPWPDGGLLKWGPLVFNCTSTLQDRKASRLLSARLGSNYLDIDVPLDRIPAMDDSRDGTMDYLTEQADKWMEQNEDVMESALAMLHAGC